MSSFALSYAVNMFILVILYDFYLSPAQFCYIIVYIRKVEKSCTNRGPVCTLKNLQWCGVSCFVGAEIVRKYICVPLIPRRSKYVITDLISVLWMVSLILALKRSLLNRK
jgi:hypothetical protein